MKKRVTIKSQPVWEDRLGFARAVRVGNMVFVAGTTAVNEFGEVVGGATPTNRPLRVRQNRPRLAGSRRGMKHVVRHAHVPWRTSAAGKLGKAHNEVFAKVKPAAPWSRSGI